MSNTNDTWEYRRDQTTQADETHTAPLPAMRRDLQISPQLYLGKTVYVVKDPVSLSYFRLKPAEYFAINQLDGDSSAQDIAEQLTRKFPDEPASADDVLAFMQMLHSAGLLQGRNERHAGLLRGMRKERTKKKTIATVANFLFIKIPLLDPDNLLEGMYRILRPLMSPSMFHLAMAFMAVTLIAAIGGIYRIGDLAFPMLGATNVMWLAVTFFIIKIIHELGHGLAAKHRGLEVHELGVLLMVFWPTFYVDVSDAWTLHQRKDRMWVSGGGVFIEFLFASLAVWIWLFTEPGLVNQAAFNIMLSASVTTLLFNVNPLLRYDGYYFLMDYVEIPNLRQKSQNHIAYLCKKYLLHMPDQRPSQDAVNRPVLMLIYAILSGIYRWVVVLGIIALVWTVLDPYGLGAVGAVMGCVALVTMVFRPIFKMLKFVWKVQARTSRRLAVSVAGVVGVVAIIFGIGAISLEDTYEQPGVILADNRYDVYIPMDGKVGKVLCKSGQLLEPGDPIIQLRDDELKERQQWLTIERSRLQVEINAERDQGKRSQLVSLAHQLQVIRHRLEYVNIRVDQLTVRSPIRGRLHVEERLETKLGTQVKQGDKLGTIIGSESLQLVMVVPQSESANVVEGMPVRARLWANPFVTHEGKVDWITRQLTDELPHDALSSQLDGEVDTMIVGGNTPAPAAPSVLVGIALNGSPTDYDQSMADGMTARGQIIVGQSTVFEQVSWAVWQSLSLDWWL